MISRDDYDKDGYVVAKNLFPAQDFSFLRDKFSKLHGENIEKYKGYLAMSAKSPAIQGMFFEDKIIDIVKFLGVNHPVPPTTPVLNVMGLTIPDGYNGTEAHQDWPSIQGSMDLITVWIPLTPTKDNYPLEVIPGSHLQGVREGKITENVTEIDITEGFIPVECEVGDVVFMSGFLIHRTGKTGNFRVAASMRFDNADEPTWKERNYYCAQKRVVKYVE